MAKRRKRNSAAALSERALKDIRRLHREHLRQISAILTNTLGFPVKVSIVPAPEVRERTPAPKRKGSPTRRVAHVAGYQQEPRPEHQPAGDGAELPRDGVDL
jgi:hypothetical protein